VIRQIWSSPIVYRRASKNHSLTPDAKAFNTEAKRRVQLARDKKFIGIQDGDRILILGEDENGKTDDLGPILVKVDQDISSINGIKSSIFKARLLAPLTISKDECEEEELGKNHSSVILNIELADDSSRKTVKKFLTGGDAEVLIWEKLWEKHETAPKVLEYDLLQTPHHCSWHSLSHDSRSKLGDKAAVSADAKSAFSAAAAPLLPVAFPSRMTRAIRPAILQSSNTSPSLMMPRVNSSAQMPTQRKPNQSPWSLSCWIRSSPNRRVK
jgi:hypothetical protein